MNIIYKDKNKKEMENIKYKAKTIFITFQEIFQLELHKTPVPEIQVSLNETKVENIVKTWLQKPHYILTERPIIIGVIKVDDDDDVEFYLLDGQHRMHSAYDIYKNHNTNNQMKCTFVELEDNHEMEELFVIVNDDSKKNNYFCKSDKFERKLINNFKEIIKNKYKDCYRNKSRKDSHIMSVSEFIENIVDNEIFKDFEVLPNIDFFITKLEKCHNEYFNKLNYLELKDHPDAFYPEEQQIIKNNKNCMFFKNNNFREAFSDFLSEKIMNVKHNYKKMRESITSKFKKDVWKKHYDSAKIGKCPVVLCKNTMSQKDFMCGYLQSFKNGGCISLDNIKPICEKCNKEMNGMNWIDYEKCRLYEYYKKKCFICKEKFDSIDDFNIVHSHLQCKKCSYNNNDNDNDDSDDSDDSESLYSVLSSDV